MNQFTAEEIQDRFEKLPKDLQDAISSAEVRDSIEKIGTKYGLHVDQLGEMVDLVGLIMLGLSPSKDFVKNFSQKTGVKDDIASSIADDINTSVFGKIRSSMQAIEVKKESMEEQAEAKNQQSITDLERIGGFTIDKEEEVGSKGGGIQTPIGTKEDLISRIEDPVPQTPSAKPLLQLEDHPDMLVDHLMANSVGAPEQKTAKTVEPPADLPGMEEPEPIQAPKPAPVAQPPQKPAGPDPYREPIA